MTITSLSTSYLEQGLVCVGKNEGVLPAVGRAAWACGTIAVAPIGLIYHLAQATLAGVRSCCTSDQKEADALYERAEEHGIAAVDDFAYTYLNLAALLIVGYNVAFITLAFYINQYAFLIIPVITALLIGFEVPEKQFWKDLFWIVGYSRQDKDFSKMVSQNYLVSQN